MLTANRLEEKEVLDGDIYGLIAPYATANLWVSAGFGTVIAACAGVLTRDLVVASQAQVPPPLL